MSTNVSRSSKKQVSCFGKNSTSPDVCSGNGDCVSYNNCTCNQGYTGNNCQFTKCFGFDSSNEKICSGNGNCTRPNYCECEDGYVGIDCKYPICFGLNSSRTDSCGLNGRCSRPDFCQCFLGYSGKICEFTECHGINSTNGTHVCSNHGNCTEYDQCICNNGYYGRTCQFEIPTDPLLYGFGLAVGICLLIIIGFIFFTPVIFLFQAILKKLKEHHLSKKLKISQPEEKPNEKETLL
eukprot:gene588-8096_t